MPNATLIIASLHALLMLWLARQIVSVRRSARVGLGDGGNDVLARRIRAHANFVEYVPIALLLLLVLELAGIGKPLLWIFGGVLLIARVLHAIGLSGSAGVSFGRFWGTALTWLTIASMAVLGLLRGFQIV